MVLNLYGVSNDVVSNDFYKRTGKVDIVDFTATTIPKNIPQTKQQIVDTSPNFKKFDMPFNASPSKVENNSIITAKIKDMSKPFPTKQLTTPNELKTINLDYDLNTMFKNADSPTPNLPMVIKQTGKTGNKTTYKGVITTPDKSVIDIDIIETNTPTGEKVQDVELKYDYDTPSGKKKFTTGYINTIDSSGKTTNSILKQSTTTDPNTGKTSLNDSDGTSAPSSSPDLSSLNDSLSNTNSKIDSLDKSLSKIDNKLGKINNTLDDIKAQQQREWNYNPGIDTSSAFASLRSEMAKFDVSVNDAFNFLNNTKNDINNLMNDFNSALEVFEEGIETPKIPNGTCPFNISGPAPGSGKVNVFTIDPCRLVSPYKSILTIFFTFWFSFEIILFSLKYLFKVGGNN